MAHKVCAWPHDRGGCDKKDFPCGCNFGRSCVLVGICPCVSVCICVCACEQVGYVFGCGQIDNVFCRL